MPPPRNTNEYANWFGSVSILLQPIRPIMVARMITEVAKMWMFLCCKPITVLNNIFIGMKNWSKVIRSNTGNTVAGQNNKNAYNISIVLKVHT